MPKYNGGKYTFISTSCILPRFPYNPLDHALAIPGLRYLAKQLPDLGAQFMLFLGDFIYVDVPQRFGKSTDEYRMQYLQIYSSPDWALVGQNMSWIHILDDHEISNDWSSNTSGIYRAAIDPWHVYHAYANPPVAVKAGSKSQRRPNATWYEFSQGPASFFMLDTRSYRSNNNKPFNEPTKTMLGKEQLEDFLSWLARPEPEGVQVEICCLVDSLHLRIGRSTFKTLGGFLVERKTIMKAMWEAATKFPPPPGMQWPDTATAFEFSTSPLNQFALPIPTYKQRDGEDVMLRYISSGSSKFGTFTIEDREGRSVLRYRLFIDGEEKWHTSLTEAPAHEDFRPRDSFWNRIKIFRSE